MTDIRLAEGCEDDARDRILAVLDTHATGNDKSFATEKLFYEVHEDGEYLGGLAARFASDLKWVYVELLAVAEAGARQRDRDQADDPHGGRCAFARNARYLAGHLLISSAGILQAPRIQRVRTD